VQGYWEGGSLNIWGKGKKRRNIILPVERKVKKKIFPSAGDKRRKNTLLFPMRKNVILMEKESSISPTRK